MQDYSIILNRIKKNLKARKSFLKSERISAYRLYEKDIPQYPYIVDIYNDHAVIYEKGLQAKNDEDKSKHVTHKKQIIDALKEVLSIPDSQIVLKERNKQKGKSQYIKVASYDQFNQIQENGCLFYVNFYDYLDTGLFLDHRPLRKIISSSSSNKKVLNLFSYTGSISVAAAMGGANVTTVDMSKKYIEWAKKNFKLNDLATSEHEFIQADVLKYLQSDLQSKLFDIIILDPPSFSNSKKMDETFNVQDYHFEMIENLMSHLSSEGVLYFSNNFRKFQISEKLQELFSVKDITYKTIPQDIRDKKIHQCFEIRNKKASQGKEASFYK